MRPQRYRPTPMPGLEIAPFAEEHLDAAATLLAERHRRHRMAEPLLPEIDDFRGEIDEVWSRDDASGTVAIRDGRTLGYLIGAPKDASWGANIWVELAGHAAEDPEVVRDLYAAASERWVGEGRTSHYALVPATDAQLVDAWFRLCFGAQHALGIREVPSDVAPPPDGMTVRTGEPDDMRTGLGTTLNEHQALSPVFSPLKPWADEDLVAEWNSDLADGKAGNFVAELDGQPVSVLQAAPVDYSSMHSGLARPSRACILGHAATLPEARGAGAGVALTNACFAWAREQGYETIVVDWRETNLFASRFWPRRGFRRTFLRLYRSIP
jgi:GNAT superfamily N-acetyltransferase